MSTTLRTLCEEYHLSTPDGTSALQSSGILVLSPDAELPAFKEGSYRKILSSAASPGPRTSPKPSKPSSTPPRPSPFLLAKTPPGAAPRAAPVDHEQRQRAILSRDLIIITYMSLRKPQTASILYQVLELKVTQRTRTQLVLCKAAADALEKDAQQFPVLETVASHVQQLKQHHALHLLNGSLACENQLLSAFIKKQDLSTSILVLGTNRSLHMFIEHRNQVNQTNPGYRIIYERDIDNKSHLANPAKQRPAFPDPEGKTKAPYPESSALAADRIPREGGTAYILKGREDTGSYEPVQLGKRLGLGGEALVYQLPDGKCAKIFKSKNNSVMKKEKIRIMVRKLGAMRAVDAALMSRLAWPEKMLYNEQREWIGYIMPAFSNTHPFADYSYDTFPALIPNVSKADQIRMSVSLTELVDFLHYNNIVLCDINTSNILFDNDQNAYLIDLDSAQVAFEEKVFPTNVGLPDYLSPEHIRSCTFDFIKKKCDDVWILQNLIFKILTPCGHPYSSSIYCEDDREYVEKGIYPFQFDKHPAEEKIRGGPWYNVISHLPYYLKEGFWESFHGEGKWFHEKERRPVSYWLNILVRYQEDLPALTAYDAESGKYLPSRAKKAPPPKAKVISKESSSLADFNELLKKLPLEAKKNKSWDSMV